MEAHTQVRLQRGCGGLMEAHTQVWLQRGCGGLMEAHTQVWLQGSLTHILWGFFLSFCSDGGKSSLHVPVNR